MCLDVNVVNPVGAACQRCAAVVVAHSVATPSANGPMLPGRTSCFRCSFPRPPPDHAHGCCSNTRNPCTWFPIFPAIRTFTRLMRQPLVSWCHARCRRSDAAWTPESNQGGFRLGSPGAFGCLGPTAWCASFSASPLLPVGSPYVALFRDLLLSLWLWPLMPSTRSSVSISSSFSLCAVSGSTLHDVCKRLLNAGHVDMSQFFLMQKRY